MTRLWLITLILVACALFAPLLFLPAEAPPTEATAPAAVSADADMHFTVLRGDSVFDADMAGYLPGAVAAALGMVSPCIIIISIIAAFLSNFQDNPYVQNALAGISVCVAALILDAVVGMWKKGVKDAFGIVVCLVMLGLSVFTSISPILLVIACALLGIGAKSIKRRKDGEAA